MKLNHKGFAISGILYSLLILFVTLFLGMLTIFASSKFSFDKIKKELINKLSYQEPNQNISSNDSCIRDTKLLCNNGTEVVVQVNETENYNFYVIKDTGNELTLIMDRNIGNKVVWISSEDYVASGGTSEDYGSYGNNNKGPLTVLNELESQTSDWINVPTMTYTLNDDGGESRYSTITRTNVRSRLLTNTEIIALGCTISNDSCPNYLYNKLSESNTVELPSGYWLSSASAEYSFFAWNVNFNGSVGDSSVKDYSYYGVRPVIILSKSL